VHGSLIINTNTNTNTTNNWIPLPPLHAGLLPFYCLSSHVLWATSATITTTTVAIVFLPSISIASTTNTTTNPVTFSP
jgi:hypothetical protein